MTDSSGITPPTEKSTIPWYWVGAFFTLALLGVLLDSKLSPENVRFIGNPLTCVGIWGAVLCVLFRKDRAKPGHPHQAEETSKIDARIAALPLLMLMNFATSICLDFPTIVNLVLGAIVFSFMLLFRREYYLPIGGSPSLGTHCRICGALLIYYFDLAITKGSQRRLATHCYFCGTNCEGPIEQPLTPTAQDVVDGKKVYREYGGSRVYIKPSKIPPDPIPFPYAEYFKELPKLIGLIIAAIFAAPFLIMFLMDGPYLALKWILVLFGMFLFVFVSRSLFSKLKAPCPHCKTDLFPLTYNSAILRRSIHYRQKDGHYVAEADPRYCPYCGKNIEEPAEKH